MTCAFVRAVGLAVVVGCDGSVVGSLVPVDGVLEVVVPESPPAGTGRPPSLESLPPQAESSRTPASAAAGRANLRTDDIPSVSSGLAGWRWVASRSADSRAEWTTGPASGVTFGVHVAGNGNGVNVQIGVGEPTVQVGQGKSMVGGTAVLMGAPGSSGVRLTTIEGIVGLSSAFLMPCSAWAWPVPTALRLCLPMRPRNVVLLAMSTWMSTCSSVRVVGPQEVTVESLDFTWAQKPLIAVAALVVSILASALFSWIAAAPTRAASWA